MALSRLRWASLANKLDYIKKRMDPFKKYIYIALLVLIFRFPPSIPFKLKNKHITNLVNSLTALHNIYINEEMPAASMKCKPKHPIIILPGMGSSTLEAWQGMKDFRTSVWGKADMLMHLLTDLIGWEKMVSLDPETGLDPPGIKVRPTNGISSSDYIMPLYWVWQKIVANLGLLGYDYTNLHVSSYDWRLDVYNLEERDSFFTKLKTEIEMYHQLNKEKVVVLGHSFANVIMMYFFSWVEIKEQGFVEKHIHALISIGAPILGTPKSISGLISGESKSSVNLTGGSLMEFFVETKILRRILNSWGSVRALLPKGGNKFWNKPIIIVNGVPFDAESLIAILKNRQSSEEILEFIKDNVEKHITTETLIENRSSTLNEKFSFLKQIVEYFQSKISELFLGKANGMGDIDNKGVNLNQVINDIKTLKVLNKTIDDAITKEKTKMGPVFDFLCTFKTMISNYGFDHKKIIREITQNVSSIMKSSESPEKLDCFKFIDPTKCKLPYAPNLKMYSFYGTGKRTECGYHYMFSKNNELKLNTKINKKNIINGIIMCDGDGTVPVISCGYMHYRGWKNSALNPSGIKTIVREYKNDYNLIKGIRGGPKTSDHVDILGNHSLMRDIIKVCCGEEDEIKDKIISNLEALCDEIDAR